jgi:hypothetical protein
MSYHSHRPHISRGGDSLVSKDWFAELAHIVAGHSYLKGIYGNLSWMPKSVVLDKKTGDRT